MPSCGKRNREVLRTNRPFVLPPHYQPPNVVSRDPMDDTSPSPRPFTVRLLPWVLGGAFLILYVVTLNPWVTPTNVLLVSQVLGWELDLPYLKSLLYVLGKVVALLPTERVPWILNGVAAVLGALTVGILARCVALLPHDRTREQRIRGHADPPLLHGWFAALPVVLAAGLLGLQLTFWENATLQTGEMLDLLLFAFCVLALLEYRLDLREGWLLAAALVWGMGITHNWAMIGFAPLFLAAIVWIRGWSFFDAAFLTRLILWGMAGLLLYFLLPLVSLLSGPGSAFWGTLRTQLIVEKSYLLGLPRGRPLLLALVTVLPLALIGIRWQGTKGTTIERYASFGAVVLLQVFWLAGTIYQAFDPPFSARQLVYLLESAGGLPLLTFGFTGALAAGYFAGWFLLVGFVPPAKTWDRPNPLFSGLAKLMAFAVVAACVAVPLALLVRNWPVIRAENSPASRQLAQALIDPLPDQPALVLADNLVVARLARAAALSRPGFPPHVFLETARGPVPEYRAWLTQRSTSAIPEIAPFGSVTENVAGVTTEIVAQLAASGRAFYLHPSFGFFFEQVQGQPTGIIRTLVPHSDEFTPMVATLEQVTSAWKTWEGYSGDLEVVKASRRLGTRNGTALGDIWSRAANSLGVDAQRLGRLEEAGQLFAESLELNPENLSAQVNLAVNAELRAGRPLPPELNTPVAHSSAIMMLNKGGPIDEPVFLRTHARALLQAIDRLPRQAWDAFFRWEQLAPGDPSPQLGRIEALLQGGQLKAARAALDRLAQSEGAQSRTRELLSGLQRLEIYYALAQGDLAGAEKQIEVARTQFASDTSLLNLLTELYIRQGRLDESVPLLEQWRKLRPDDPKATLRLAAIQVRRGQYEPALRLLDQVLVMQPENLGARLNRAICLLRLNRLDDARREYRALAEKIPDYPATEFGLAEIALRRGETNAALGHFEKYLQFAPTNTLEYSNVVERVAGLRNPSR